jgi:hypothetical protein
MRASEEKPWNVQRRKKYGRVPIPSSSLGVILPYENEHPDPSLLHRLENDLTRAPQRM